MSGAATPQPAPEQPLDTPAPAHIAEQPALSEGLPADAVEVVLVEVIVPAHRDEPYVTLVNHVQEYERKAAGAALQLMVDEVELRKQQRRARERNDIAEFMWLGAELSAVAAELEKMKPEVPYWPARHNLAGQTYRIIAVEAPQCETEEARAYWAVRKAREQVAAALRDERAKVRAVTAKRRLEMLCARRDELLRLRQQSAAARNCKHPLAKRDVRESHRVRQGRVMEHTREVCTACGRELRVDERLAVRRGR